MNADLLCSETLFCGPTNTGQDGYSGTAFCTLIDPSGDAYYGTGQPFITFTESYSYTVFFTGLDSNLAAALGATAQPISTPTAGASSNSSHHSLSVPPSTKIGAGVGVSLGVLALGVVGLLAFRRRLSKRTKPKGPSELYFNDAGTRQVEAAGIEGGEITKGSK